MIACDLSVKHSNDFIPIQDEKRKEKRKALKDLNAFPT